MIACITDAELSFGDFSVPVLRREAVPSIRRMAEELFNGGNGADDELKKRLEALERLKQSWQKLNRPLGGKWWKSRADFYDD